MRGARSAPSRAPYCSRYGCTSTAARSVSPGLRFVSACTENRLMRSCLGKQAIQAAHGYSPLKTNGTCSMRRIRADSSCSFMTSCGRRYVLWRMREDSHRVNRAGQYLQRHLGGRSKPASREKLELGVDVAIVVAIVGDFHGRTSLPLPGNRWEPSSSRVKLSIQV